MTEPVKRRIPETVVPGKRLGRHVVHDPRSLQYLHPEAAKPASTVVWTRVVPVYDQGSVGSCTGQAAAGALGTLPLEPTLPASFVDDEAEAVKLYSAAEVIDGDGPYPPNDNGSSGLSVAKACRNAGLISGYQHITSLAAAYAAIQSGPFIVGSDWHTGMDTPDANGVVQATGAVRGGHEYECVGYHPDTDLWEFVNSWGLSYGVQGRFFYTSATFTQLLAAQGDATVFVPVNQPAPTPTPTPTPQPAPTPPAANVGYTFTAADAATLDGWAAKHHIGCNEQAAAAWKRGTPS